jgi:hypothetical protein
MPAELRVGPLVWRVRDVGPIIALYDRYWTEIKAR